MDKIHVSENALVNSAKALQQLAEQSTRIIKSCIQELELKLSELDTDFKDDIESYIKSLQILDYKISSCAQENISAISVRQTKLSKYKDLVYRKRNMG